LRGRRSREDAEEDDDLRKCKATKDMCTCISIDGYDNKTDYSNVTTEATQDAAMQQGWKKAVGRQKKISGQKRRAEKAKFHKLSQKGVSTSASIGKYATAYTDGENAAAYADENADENASTYAGTCAPMYADVENADENASMSTGAYATTYTTYTDNKNAGTYVDAYVPA
jgi:hypothetical protein